MEPPVSKLSEHIGETVTVRGWLTQKRSSGKIGFVEVRDGSAVVQTVASRAELSESAWQEVQRAAQESTVRVTGRVHEDARSPGGVELHVTDFVVESLSEDFPISPKEHGVGFLMEQRHLWLRSRRQQRGAARCAARSRRRFATSSTSATTCSSTRRSSPQRPARGPRPCSRPTTSVSRPFSASLDSSTSSPPPPPWARCTASDRPFGRKSRRRGAT